MMNITELSWTEQGSRYLLSVTTPESMEQDRVDEIALVIHNFGFSSQGEGRWLSPEDPNTPAEMLAALEDIGLALEMDTAVLPPSLLMVMADIQFVGRQNTDCRRQDR